MKLELENIGKIEQASIENNGITVIVGKNNTGKSTVSKALFSVFNALHNIQNQAVQARIESIESNLSGLLPLSLGSLKNGDFVSQNINNLATEIVNNLDEYRQLSNEKFQEILESQLELLCPAGTLGQLGLYSESKVVVTAIQKILSISDEDFLVATLNNKLQSEFGGQVCNIFSDNPQGRINLVINGNSIDIAIMNNGVASINRSQNFSLYNEAIYLDDPFILDLVNSQFSMGKSLFSGKVTDHKSHLIKCLLKSSQNVNVFYEIMSKDKLNRIFQKINEVCVGDIVFSLQMAGFSYKLPKNGEMLRVSNLAAGIKTFAVLKKLLNDCVIKDGGVMIFDEPESHLHPESQLLLAEIMVLLHKDFGQHILLSTHSPYFLRAIDFFANKYEVANSCKYYNAKDLKDVAIIDDVSSELDSMYANFSAAFQNLESVYWD